jgi:hypothetical protein
VPIGQLANTATTTPNGAAVTIKRTNGQAVTGLLFGEERIA